MRQCDHIGLAKAILWEEAKGKLRALVMADGAKESADRGVSFSFEKISNRVEAFIDEFEADGLYE